MRGYRELRESAAWFDLSARGKIRVTGEDRVRLLHAMTTNHIQQLTPGTGCYAFFLSAQGRILGDANILCFADSFLLDTEPETREKLYQHLDKYIIADDVVLEDITERVATVGVEGPKAAEVLSSIGAPLPEAWWSWADWGARRISKVSRTGQRGWWIFASPSDIGETIREIQEAGAVEAEPAAVHTVRLENGVPRYGEDVTEANLPQETQLLHAIHFNKGCYIGQEIVERVRSRGHVNRLLVPLLIEAGGDSQPIPKAGIGGSPRFPAEFAAGDSQPIPKPGIGGSPPIPVLAGGSEAGALTSAAWSPALGKVAALAYLRAEFVRAKPALTVAGSAAQIASSAPALPAVPPDCP